MQGGAIDVMPAVLGATLEHVKAGRMKVLGVVDKEAHALLPDAKPITADYPVYEKYLVPGLSLVSSRRKILQKMSLLSWLMPITKAVKMKPSRNYWQMWFYPIEYWFK